MNNPGKMSPLNILVVDDEEEICKLFNKFLSARGHVVRAVVTGKKAINRVEKENYDVVFLDIVMPGTPGDEVLERIKEISPRTRVIMITGNLVNKNLLRKMRRKGASGFLQKPFTMEDIMETLHEKNRS